MKPSITPAKPRLMPAISLPPVAVPFVADAEGEEVVPDAAEAAAAAAVGVGGLRERLWPRVGRAGLPSTSHPSAVEDGQAGAESLVAWAE